jgi:hypothetical protein
MDTKEREKLITDAVAAFEAGMRWNEGNAQEMVTLKAKKASGSWGASVRDFIMAA